MKISVFQILIVQNIFSKWDVNIIIYYVIEIELFVMAACSLNLWEQEVYFSVWNWIYYKSLEVALYALLKWNQYKKLRDKKKLKGIQ